MNITTVNQRVRRLPKDKITKDVSVAGQTERRQTSPINSVIGLISGGFRAEAREAMPPLKIEERKCTHCF